MHRWPLKLQIFQSPRFIPLRYRVILVTSGLLILVLGTLALVLGLIQSRTIKRQLEERGRAIAQSIAAASVQDLLNYNYIALERVANQAAQAPDIVYVAVHDKEGRVAGFSGRPELQGELLSDEVSGRALRSATPLIQQTGGTPGGTPGLDVSIPVNLPDAGGRWGTVRVCASLSPMYRQIRQTLWIIASIGLSALAVGILLSIWGARRITQPLGDLVQATLQAARGNLKQTFSIKTGDEVEVLAANFAAMMEKILTHQKRQEIQLAEIRRLQQYTEKLMSAMADGLLSVDTNGTVATVNPAARRLLGIAEQEDLLGQPLSALIGEMAPLHRYVMKALNAPEEIFQQEIQFLRAGETHTILVGVSILNNEHKRPQEIIFNIHDITELKKLEARIRQSERLAALGTLAAGMAHEIRNPLSAIKTFVQLLPRKIDKPGFLEKFNRTVPRETNRINLLVEELLELSREPKYNFLPIDIAALLDQSMETHWEELQRQQIEYRRQIETALPLVRADANQLTKAFQNLTRNAIQAMPRGGRLTVKICTQGTLSPESRDRVSRDGQLTIVFQDTGMGIPPKALKHIFDPFFTTKDSGTGLGLPITHKVISEHGGQIEAESREGQGTRFTIRLPLYDVGPH